jgi:disease resistance protein RPM1
LSILDLQGIQIKRLPDVVFSLFNLRFLSLRYSRIEVLQEAVGRLVNLEVLDANGTRLLSLPKGVANLMKLRYLYAWAFFSRTTVTLYHGTEVPRGIRNLTGLHALQGVKVSLETLCDIAALLELRSFTVSNVKSEHSLNLCTAIMNMNRLAHLSIGASNENDVLPMEALHLPATLSTLALKGQLEKRRMSDILSSWSHLSSLTQLILGFFKLDEESFSSLVVLHGLCFLQLSKAYDGNKLFFPAHSLPRLQILVIRDAPRLDQINMEEGALASLVELQLKECPELKCLPRGIENLAALEDLYLEDTAEELIEKLRQKRDADECNKEFMTISHIKKVTVVLTEKHTGKNSLNEGTGCCGSHAYDFHFSDVFLSYYVFEWFGLMCLSGISHATTEYVLVSVGKISLISICQTDIIYTI